MGNSLSNLHGDTMSIVCKLVTDNEGRFAALVPVDFVGPEEGRAEVAASPDPR